jgi:hypothetical protein
VARGLERGGLIAQIVERWMDQIGFHQSPVYVKVTGCHAYLRALLPCWGPRAGRASLWHIEARLASRSAMAPLWKSPKIEWSP